MTPRTFLAAACAALVLVPAAAAQAPAATDAPLDHAPQWRLGDWWEVTVTNANAGAAQTARVVVAGEDAEHWLVGMPAASFNAAHIIHEAVPLGAVGKRDLARDLGGVTFQPLRFPIVNGATWPTTYDGAPHEARVTHVAGAHATVTYTPANGGPVLTGVYDAEMGFFRSFERAGLWSFTVAAHGSNYRCAVDVPHDVRVIATDLPGGVANARDAGQSTVTLVDVPAGSPRVALYTFAGASGAGRAAETVTGPDGTAYRATAAGRGGGAHTVLNFFSAAQPPGVWTFERTVLSGVAWAEVFGFATTRHTFGDAPTCEVAAAMQQAARPHAAARSADEGPGAGLAAFAVGGAVLAWLLRAPVHWLIAVRSASRLTRQDVLAHPVRERILALLATAPGLTLEEIGRALGSSRSTVHHHVRLLHRHGLLTPVSWGRAKDWYVTARHPLRDRLWRSAQKRAATRTLLAAVAARPGLTQQDLAGVMGVHHKAVIFHERRLVKWGLVAKRADGRCVRYYAAEP